MEDSNIRFKLDFSFLETFQHNDDLYIEAKSNESAFPISNVGESEESTEISRKYTEELCFTENFQTDSRNSSIESNSKVSVPMNPLLRLLKAMDIVLFLQNEIGKIDIKSWIKALDILNISLIIKYESSRINPLFETESNFPIEQNFITLFNKNRNLILQDLVDNRFSSENHEYINLNQNNKLEYYKSLIKPANLAHPDEFKNPSSFLKVYGDPLCKGKEKRNQNCKAIKGGCPKTGVQGNWKCSNCLNVNFPRRFNCLKCNTKRNQIDDEMVKNYAIEVYKELLPLYNKTQSFGARISKVDKESFKNLLSFHA